jgi:hypothetical protein
LDLKDSIEARKIQFKSLQNSEDLHTHYAIVDLEPNGKYPSVSDGYPKKRLSLLEFDDKL